MHLSMANSTKYPMEVYEKKQIRKALTAQELSEISPCTEAYSSLAYGATRQMLIKHSITIVLSFNVVLVSFRRMKNKADVLQISSKIIKSVKQMILT